VTADFDLGLRITNVSDQPLTISTFDVIRPRLYTADGKEVQVSIGRNGMPRPTAPATLAPGASWTWQPKARLSFTREGGQWLLDGPDGRGVSGVWAFLSLQEGKYRLSLEYANAEPKQGDASLWVGRATTENVEFDLVPPDKEEAAVMLEASKAVRVNDADFQGVIEPRRPAPAPGGEQDIDLGLRITNRREKLALLFDLNKIQPVLKDGDGKLLQLSGVRKRTAFAAPLQLGPGESQTVLWRGHLEWPKDADSFRLRYVDGTMFGGTFDGLRPGKYRLGFQYEADPQAANTLDSMYGVTPKGLSTWTGQATTDEVAFEIVPGMKGMDTPEPRPIGILAAELESADGRTRLAATKDIFGGGKAAVQDLEKAGAKPIAPAGTINPRRLDVVYSLLKGLPPNPPTARSGYKTDSFGLHLEVLGSQADVERMGKQYGFSLTGTFGKAARPNCYVTLEKGKSLSEVMQAVLTSEAKVITLNLNYFEE
jgi:hypothetical protein